jgi:uroporphyrinogen-III synthase
MPQPLEGRTIALAESRQLSELAALLESEGATALRCPMLSILDLPDPAAALAWINELIAKPFDYTIFLTGEGVRRLTGVAEGGGLKVDFVAALGRSRMVTRGPKPVRALRELALAPTLVASTPTTTGLIDCLKPHELQGQRVGVQNYPGAPPALDEFLRSQGAQLRAIVPYIYAPDADADRVAELIRAMSDGRVDAIVFTSSPQVDRLFEVARDRGLEAQLAPGWERTRVASIGPVVGENLRRRGVRVDIVPDQGFVMKNLVQHIRRAFV